MEINNAQIVTFEDILRETLTGKRIALWENLSPLAGISGLRYYTMPPDQFNLENGTQITGVIKNVVCEDIDYEGSIITLYVQLENDDITSDHKVISVSFYLLCELSLVIIPE